MAETPISEARRQDSARPTGPAITIPTDRFILETLGPEHAGLVAEWMGSSRVNAALGQAAPAHSAERAAAYIASFDRLTKYILGIRVRATDSLAGFYTLQVDAHGVGSINIVIGEDTALRQAVAIETARALVDWSFQERKLEKITARVAETNQITADWLRTRMTLEGCLRDQIRLPDGRRAGVLMFGLLKSEWEALRRWSIENQALKHSRSPSD